MPAGGAGRGQGRKIGSKNLITKRAIKQSTEDGGILPHEWLLKVVRGEPVEQRRWSIKYDEFDNEISRELITEMIYPTFDHRVDAAKAAAPFYAPRLATQTVSVNGGSEIIAQTLKLMADKLPV